ncbi:unnamed protein product [Didymodactylos carnosus]|uniref:Uncharacterized protein n=1 Tax=Didymodactylos carnosus TaxID=1234261 RepID=A0A814ZQD7_9BILA|nr:unnamed protein product [Didymodactylos carnosus]CAF4012040.1 unnamed protein product [Didymodactylos carnosus]
MIKRRGVLDSFAFLHVLKYGSQAIFCSYLWQAHSNTWRFLHPRRKKFLQRQKQQEQSLKPPPKRGSRLNNTFGVNLTDDNILEAVTQKEAAKKKSEGPRRTARTTKNKKHQIESSSVAPRNSNKLAPDPMIQQLDRILSLINPVDDSDESDNEDVSQM